jgi:hypothetical protein
LEKSIKAFIELLRTPIVAVVFVSVISVVVLYFLHDYGIASTLTVTILAFIASDILSALFVRGGKRAVQIPFLGNRIQPEGYVFLAFFISIVIVGVLVNWVTDEFTKSISASLNDITVCIPVGLGLAGLVYLDMLAKFYARKKTR